jgi:predicted amidohydrolase
VKAVAVQVAAGLDRAENRKLAVGHVRAAAADGAGLVVLPEAMMCAFGTPGRDLSPDAEPLDGPFVAALGAAAADCGVHVVAGMFEPGRAGRVHNTVVAIGPAGLIGTYRKFHLYDALGWRESDQVEPGDPRRESPLVFDAGGLRFGVMNCYDLRFPEMARALVDRGATVLLEPANWIAGPGKADVFVTLLRARAIENTCWVVAAAKPGPECAGCSSVVDPSGAVVERLGEDGSGTVSAELSAARVDEVRAVLPVLENRRFTVSARRD